MLNLLCRLTPYKSDNIIAHKTEVTVKLGHLCPHVNFLCLILSLGNVQRYNQF